MNSVLSLERRRIWTIPTYKALTYSFPVGNLNSFEDK